MKVKAGITVNKKDTLVYRDWKIVICADEDSFFDGGLCFTAKKQVGLHKKKMKSSSLFTLLQVIDDREGS